MKIEIISSQNPEGSAIDGVFASASFKVISGDESTILDRKRVQDLIWQWNDECELYSYGHAKGGGDLNGALVGVMVFVDCAPPKAGELITFSGK